MVMKVKHFVFFLFLLLACGSIFSQQNLPVPLNIQRTYQEHTRTQDGKPGEKYWQNTADYFLDIHFDPVSLELDGTDSIIYTNNSPDTLHRLWFKLYPNFYKKGSPRDTQILPGDVSDGVRITSMELNGIIYDSSSYKVNGTNMVVSIPDLNPKKVLKCRISYSYILNRHSHQRTGQVDEGSDFVAYFFPRIAVYDDLDGWNQYPYLGSQEFYNDFCNFKVSITVPRNYLIWATGSMENGDQVLSPLYCRRIEMAGKTDSVTTIIGESDLSKGNITADHPFNTWKFDAENVTDFVFATSNHYMWQAASLVVDPTTGRRTRVDAVFNPVHRDYFHVAGYARKTVKAMSYVFPAWPFPYPHETVFDGLDQMEYPMMVNDNPLDDKAQEIELTDHEIFHTMFPFYMGINETKYGWMDEGWATMGEWLISPMIDSTVRDTYGIAAYEADADNETDLPIMTLTTEMHDDNAFFLNSYPKPAMGYLFIRNMLGDSLFTKALHYYIQNWHGKHPGPYDFFNCMNTGSGENLNWFWKRWYFDSGAPDLAITKFSRSGSTYRVEITAKGIKPVPICLTVTFSDNTMLRIKRSIACWQDGTKTVILDFNSAKKVRKLVLGGLHIPDIHKSDNIYRVK